MNLFISIFIVNVLYYFGEEFVIYDDPYIEPNSKP